MNNRRLLAVLAGAALVLAGLAGCAPPPSGPCTMTLATVVPMQQYAGGDRLLVDGGVNGKDVKLMLDTGSFATLLSQSAMLESERKSSVGVTGMRGLGGLVYAPIAQIHEVTLGRLHGPIQVVNVPFGGGKSKNPAVGLLGMDIIGNYDIDLDLLDNQLRLYKTSGQCVSAITALAPPLYSVPYISGGGGDDSSPTLPVTIGGLRMTATVDTGSPGTLITSLAARRLGLDLHGDQVVPVRGFGPATTKGHLHALDRLVLGDLALRHVPVTVLSAAAQIPVDVILGMDLVRRVHLWMSNSSHRLVMQYPPVASPEMGAGN